ASSTILPELHPPGFAQKAKLNKPSVIQPDVDALKAWAKPCGCRPSTRCVSIFSVRVKAPAPLLLLDGAQVGRRIGGATRQFLADGPASDPGVAVATRSGTGMACSARCPPYEHAFQPGTETESCEVAADMSLPGDHAAKA